MEREKRSRGENQDAEEQVPERYEDNHVEAQVHDEAELSEGALAGPSAGDAGLAAQEEYTPAETWDGLEHIGHKGDWRDIEPTEADHFTP